MTTETFPVLDTSRPFGDTVTASIRGMTPLERFEQVHALNQLCEQLATAGVKSRHPEATDREVRMRVFALRLGRQLMIDVYGWDPDLEGW